MYKYAYINSQILLLSSEAMQMQAYCKHDKLSSEFWKIPASYFECKDIWQFHEMCYFCCDMHKRQNKKSIQGWCYA